MTALRARALLRWYDSGHRDLPWRRDPSPYKVLVSELMLQQTVVATVEPYFRRFIERFPDVQALAAATDDEVSALWSGLGYYARARNLRRAAETIVGALGGVFPSTEEALRALPGVGDYTAAAVAAIAFGARAFALDGNGLRVLARLTGERAPIDLPATRRALHALGLAAVPASRPGDFNQAVMELGATVCTPRRPHCGECPLAAGCRARAEGTTDEIPRKRPRAERPVVRVLCAFITDGTHVLVQKRTTGLLGGTWTLPEQPHAGADGGPALARRLAEGAGELVRDIRRVRYQGAVRHVFTHRDVTADVFRVEARPARGGQGASVRWVLLDGLRVMGISSFTRKTLALGLGPGSGGEKRDNTRRAP
jgi:A/G-specific adenine glycosylase